MAEEEQSVEAINEDNPVCRKVARLMLDVESRFHLGPSGLNYLYEGIIDTINLANATESSSIKIPALGSQKKRNNYFFTNFLYNQPKAVFLGYDQRILATGPKSVPCMGYYIPFQTSLDTMLRLPEIQKFCLERKPEVESTFFNGCYSSKLEDELLTIFVSISFDEIELVRNKIKITFSFEANFGF
jgi:hypothetical protein